MESQALNTLTTTVTAFSSWSQLEASLKNGYVPTLTTSESDEVAVNAAKVALRLELEARGFRVYMGQNQPKAAKKELTLDELRARYASARKHVMALKGRAMKARKDSWSMPGYPEASDRLKRVRKELRRAEKKATKG